MIFFSSIIFAIIDNSLPEGLTHMSAAKYFKSKDYYKPLFMCTNDKCTCVDYETPKNGVCPFCKHAITSKSVVRPWGFAPQNGTSIREAEAESENSYATSPTYALPLDESKLKNIDRLDVQSFSNFISIHCRHVASFSLAYHNPENTLPSLLKPPINFSVGPSYTHSLPFTVACI